VQVEETRKNLMTRITRMTRIPRKTRKTKAMEAPMRLSSQIFTRRWSPRENEKPSRRTKPDEPGEDEGEGGGDNRDDTKKRRTPNTCLPQANQRSMRLWRKTNLAEKVKTKKQTDNEKTEKSCHRRTIRTYIYAGLPCRVSPWWKP
jgi:hypothetical protein